MFHLWYDKTDQRFLKGPGEITIYSTVAFEAMDGPNNNNTRSDWYDLIHPRTSPIFSRDEESHTKKRRVWNQALSTKGDYWFYTSGLPAERFA